MFLPYYPVSIEFFRCTNIVGCKMKAIHTLRFRSFIAQTHVHAKLSSLLSRSVTEYSALCRAALPSPGFFLSLRRWASLWRMRLLIGVHYSLRPVMWL